MIRKLGKSLLWGFLANLAIVLATIALSVVGTPYLLSAYVISGIPLGSILSAVVPDSFVYWLVPDGGGPAAVGIFFVSAFIQSIIVLTIAFYFLSKEKSTTNVLRTDNR